MGGVLDAGHRRTWPDPSLKLKSAAEPSREVATGPAPRRYGVRGLTRRGGAAVADGTDLVTQVEGETAVRPVAAQRHRAPDKVALRRMRPDGSDVEEWTWARVGDASARLASAFGRLGLGRGDRRCLAAQPARVPPGRPGRAAGRRHADVDLQLLLARPGRVPGGHAGARSAIVEDVGFLRAAVKVRDELPELRAVVVVDDPEGGPRRRASAWPSCSATTRSTSTTAATVASRTTWPRSSTPRARPGRPRA